MASVIKLKISDLNCPVNIYRKVLTPNGIGGFTVTYALASTVWAHIEVWRGKEGYRAERTEGLVSQRVIVRSQTAVSIDDVVVFKGRTMPVKYKNELTEGSIIYKELFCVEGDPTGWAGTLT